MGRVALVLLVGLGGGCATRLLEPASDAGAGGEADMAGACFTHAREVEPIARIEAVDPLEALALGRAIRVRVTREMPAGCALGGSIDVTGPTRDGEPILYRLTSWVWRATDGAACAPTRAVTEVVLLPDEVAGYAVMTVADATGDAKITLGLAGPSMDDCTAVGLDGDCTRDCQCQASVQDARCVPTEPRHGRCKVSCNRDGDCAQAGASLGRCDVVGAQGPAFTCVNAVGCHGDDECGFGARCVPPASGGGPATCVPSQSDRTDEGCSCDGDCGFGQVCKHEADLAFCAIPCAVDGDCASGRRCVESMCQRTAPL